jgi:transposase-like protein
MPTHRKKRTRVNRTREEVHNIIGEFQASGLTQIAFGKARGINPNLLGRWMRDERERATTRKKTSKSRVIPVRIRRPSAPTTPDVSHGTVEIVLANGRRLRVPAGFDEDSLLRLVNLLEVTPC